MASPAAPAVSTEATTTHLATTAALRTYLVARKVAARGRRSFPPDHHSSRLRLGPARPSPLGPKGRAVSGPTQSDGHLVEDDEGWSSDEDEAHREAGTTDHSSESDNSDLGVVKRAKSRTFVRGVGKRYLTGASPTHKRRRTPSGSVRRETPTKGAVGSPQARLAHPAATPNTSPSKPLRATSTPYTPIAARNTNSVNDSNPTTPEFAHGLSTGSFSPESTTSGGFPPGQHHPSPTSSQSSFSLVTPAIQQHDMFDTSVDSIIIVHDRPVISDKFAKGPAPVPVHPAQPASTPTSSAISTTPLSPFAKPFVATPKRGDLKNAVDTLDSPTPRVSYVSTQLGDMFSPGTSATMKEKRGSPEKEGLVRQILQASTPAKMVVPVGANEEVSAKTVRMIMKRPAGHALEDKPQAGTAIAVMVGPESLPYARNPSGVDGSVVGADGRLNVWMASAQDPECEYVETFQRRPGAANPVFRGKDAHHDPNAAAYCHPSTFRVQPHGRGRFVPQIQPDQHRPLPLPYMGSPIVGNTPYNHYPSPSPSWSVTSFDSRACFPPQLQQPQQQQLRYGHSPPTFYPVQQQPPQQQQQFNPAPLQQMYASHQHHQNQPQPQPQHPHQHQQPSPVPPPTQQQPAPVAFDQGQPSRRAFSSEELLEVASNLLGIGLGHPTTFSRSGMSSPGGGGGSGANEYDRQASQLERLLFLSSVAATLRSASDNITSAASTTVKEALTPRSVSSPSPSVLLGPATATGPPALPIDAHPTPPSVPLLRATSPLPAVANETVAITADTKSVASTAPAAAACSAATEAPRVRAETYQVRGNGFRSRANTLINNTNAIPSSPPGLSASTASAPTIAHNHSAHEETFLFLRAGTAPGFANNGERRPGPRAGLPKRTMAMRAIDAMRNASRREGSEGGKLVAREREEVFEREEVEAEETVGEPVIMVRVGDLASKKEKAKIGEGRRVPGSAAGRTGANGRHGARTASVTAKPMNGDGYLTLGTLSAMFGESNKSNVPAALPTKPQAAPGVKPKSFSHALSLGLPNKPDSQNSSPVGTPPPKPIPSPKPTTATRANRSSSTVSVNIIPPTPPAPTTPHKGKASSSRSRKRSGTTAKGTPKALREARRAA